MGETSSLPTKNFNGVNTIFFGAMLIAGHDGIINKIEPPVPLSVEKS